MRRESRSVIRRRRDVAPLHYQPNHSIMLTYLIETDEELEDDEDIFAEYEDE